MASSIFPTPAINARVDTTRPPTITTIQDTNISKLVCQFATGSSQDGHWSFYIPPNYLSGTATVRVRWFGTPGAGNVYLALYTNSLATAGAYSPAGQTTGPTAYSTSGANYINEAVFTGITIASDNWLELTLQRQGGNASDTLGAAMNVESISVEYTSDATITRGYIWMPANAFAIPSATTATLGKLASDGTVSHPYAIAFPQSVNAYCDCRMLLPSSYLANLKLTTVIVPNTASATQWKHSVATGGINATADPALTAGTAWNLTGGATGNIYIDTVRALPGGVTPNAGDEVVLRVTRTDAIAVTAYLVGVLWTYDLYTSSPGVIRLEPGSCGQPTSNPATIARMEDTNTDKWVARFAQGVQSEADFQQMIPSTYSSGGTLRVRWRAAAASGNAVFRADFKQIALNSSDDPVLTSSANVVSACGGSGLQNECLIPVTSLAASNTVNVRLNRLGNNTSDTLAATVDVLDVHLETYIQ